MFRAWRIYWSVRIGGYKSLFRKKWSIFEDICRKFSDLKKWKLLSIIFR
jgi:hypothetical protein